MNKHIRLIIVAVVVVALGISLPERSRTLGASQQSRASNVREDRSRKHGGAEAPPECVAITRGFIAYILRKEPDIAKDKEAQNRWLTEYLRKGLTHRQQVYAEYVKREPDST